MKTFVDTNNCSMKMNAKTIFFFIGKYRSSNKPVA